MTTKTVDMKFERDDGTILTLGGFSVVNVPVFKELDGAKFLELRKTFALDLIFASMFSMCLFSVLLKINNGRQKADSKLKDLGLDIFQNKETEIDFNFS